MVFWDHGRTAGHPLQVARPDPEFVFTYVAVYGNKRPGRVRAGAYALTYTGAKTARQRLPIASGLDFRFHDFRHDFDQAPPRDR